MSLSRVSPRLLRARRRLQHRRCAVMFTSQTPCQSSGCYCVVPLNLLASPWMLWRAFWPPLSQRCFCRFPCWILPRTLRSRPDHGTCHSDFGTAIPFFCGLCKAAGGSPSAAACLAANYLHGGPYGRRRALLAQKPFVLCRPPTAACLAFAGLLCPCISSALDESDA